jgi:hypothetical protein
MASNVSCFRINWGRPQVLFYVWVQGFTKPPHQTTNGTNSLIGLAQAVCRYLLTAVVCVLAQVLSYGICGGQSGTRVCSLRVLHFPCHSFHRLLHTHNLFIIRGWNNTTSSGRCNKWAHFHSNLRSLKKITYLIAVKINYKK